MVDGLGLGALRLAGAVLKHFLDGPERRLRMRKLELEIQRLLDEQARARTVAPAAQPDHAAVLAEVRRIADALPGVVVVEERRRGAVLVREDDVPGAADAVQRLAAVVEARRAELMSADEPDASGEPGEIEWSAPVEEAPVSDAARRLGNLERRMRERREPRH